MLGDMIGHKQVTVMHLTLDKIVEKVQAQTVDYPIVVCPAPKGDMDDPKRRSATRYNEKGNYRL